MMPLLLACSGSPSSSTGNTQLNLDIVNSGGTSGELAFTIDRVDYRITCSSDAVNPAIPPADTTGTEYAYDDSVDISGAFEVVDTRVPPVWQAVMDLPPGDCTITLSVYEDDEVVCAGSQTLAISEDATTKYDIVLVCSLSVDTPDGMADVDGTFEFITGNLCPNLYVLNAVPSLGIVGVTASSPRSEIQYRAKDPDDTCGANCDPQSCSTDNPPICTPYPSNMNDPYCNAAMGGDPNSAGCLAGDHAGLVCTLSATNYAGTVGTFISPTDGVTPVGPILPVNLNTAAGLPGIILPGLGGPAGTNAANSPAYPPLPNTNGSLPPLYYDSDLSFPGPVTISLVCSDGDAECDQTKTIEVYHFTPHYCQDTPIDCSGSGECLTDGVCDNFCSPLDATNGLCDRCPGMDLPVADGTLCGVDGACQAGTCVEPAWSAPVQIGGSGTFAILVQLAFDPDGNATAVWTEGDGSYYDIWANRYTPGSGWGTPALIESSPGIAYRPKLAVDLNGNATVVWRQHDQSDSDIWSNRYTPGSGWGTAVLVENSAGDAFEPEIAIDPDGNATAVWYQDNGSDSDIWSNRYTPTTGWGTPARVESIAGDARNPRVAVDQNGNATVVWAQRNGSDSDVWANRYAPTTGWGTPVRIDAGLFAELDPRIALDPNGDAIVVWRHSSLSDWGIWSNHYTSTSGWGTATPVASHTRAMFPAEVAIDASGNATAVWPQLDVSDYDLWSSRYTPGSGWGSPVLIESLAGDALGTGLAVDADGNVTTTWVQDDEVDRAVWSKRYIPSSGWGAPVLVDGRPGNASGAQPAVDPDGNVTVGWSYGNGAYADVWFSRFE